MSGLVAPGYPYMYVSIAQENDHSPLLNSCYYIHVNIKLITMKVNMVE